MVSRVIFVCTGNTCRSPMAEVILKSMNEEGPTVISRGIAAFPGDAMNEKSLEALIECGVLAENPASSRMMELKEGALNKRSERLHPDDLVPNTLILTMTKNHKIDVENLLDFWGAKEGVQVYTLSEYGGGSGDIEDPYGRNQMTYDICCISIMEYMDKINKRITECNKTVAKED